MGRIAGVYDPGHDWLKVIRVEAANDGEALALAQPEAEKMRWRILNSKEIPIGQFHFLCSNGYGTKSNPHW